MTDFQGVGDLNSDLERWMEPDDGRQNDGGLWKRVKPFDTSFWSD